MKRIVLAVIAVFVLWTVMDMFIHGMLLLDTYKATEQLWRPDAEIKNGLLTVVGLISAITFVLIYALMGSKSVATGFKYGLLFGLGAGVSFGYATYAVMPIPYNLALTWFLGTWAEATVGGIVAGLIVK